MSAVSLRGLSYSYPARSGAPARQALDGVSFEVAPGRTFGLLGPNGGGKSTLFKVLATALKPEPGRAFVFGLDLARQAPAARPRLGVVFQNPSLDAKLTVEENMLHQGRLYGLSGASLRSRVGELLERYRLGERRRDLAGTLSGGLKRRVEIAKGLIHSPELVLLDEPSTGLDPGARRDLWRHLKELKGSGNMTMLVTTHLLDEAEACDQLVLLDRGRVAASGTPQELKAAIGGDVITIESPDPDALAAGIRSRFGSEPARVDSTLRLERARGHAFIPELVEAFPRLVASVSLSKPTLEDVFIHHTGHRFWEERRP